MTTAVFVDCEQPVRDWLRTQALVNIDARVYVGIPSDAVFPLIDVSLLDGGIQPSVAPLAIPLFSFSIWGGSKADRNAVKQTAWALAELLHETAYAALSTDLALLGSQIVLGPVPRFDPDGTPRYLLDAALTVRVR